MKQKITTLILLLCTISSGAYCATDSNCNKCNKDNSSCACSSSSLCSPCETACGCCECTPKPSCLPPCDAGYNSPYRMGVCWDFNLTASFIYWQAIEDGLETGTSISGSMGENVSWLNSEFNFNPGFKVGLGMNFDWDNWDFLIEYTWLHTSETTGNHESEILAAYIATTLPGDTLDSVWNFCFDMLDFNIGRPCYVGRFLIFRPHFGGKAFWLDQKFNQTLSFDELELFKGENSSSAWAIGARAGLQTRWDFYCGFYMFGNGAYSLMYTQIDSLKASVSEDIGCVSQSGKKTFTPSAELALGLGWGDFIDCNSRWYLNLTLGYEFLAFWDQNHWRNFYSTNTVDNNLYLQGLTIGVRLDF